LDAKCELILYGNNAENTLEPSDEEDIWVRKKWWTRRLNCITQHASWFAFSS